MQVGLRPKVLKLIESQGPVRVDLRERLGGVSYDYLSTPTGERIVVQSDEDDEAAEGRTATVTFDPASALYFDVQSGTRLR